MSLWKKITGSSWKKMHTPLKIAGAVAAAYFGAPYVSALLATSVGSKGSNGSEGSEGSTVGDLVGKFAPSLISGASGIYSTNKSISASKEAVAAQNAYNSPAAQMQRLQAAGLNPNLVYGSGNVVGNQSGTYSSDYSGYGTSVNNALNTYMAIDNHDMEMQMKAEQILAAQKNNKWIDVNNALQISKTLMEDKILNAQLLSAKESLNILKARSEAISHNLSINKKKFSNTYWNVDNYSDNNIVSTAKNLTSLFTGG